MTTILSPKFISNFAVKASILFLSLFITSFSVHSQTTAIRMDMEWLSSTTNTADFQIRLTNTGTSTVTFNALIIRGVHDTTANLTSGTITWKALNNNTLPGWLNWPNTGTANLPYISSLRKLNFSSSNGIFTSATAQAIPSGSGVVVGTFRVYTTATWAPNSDFGFVWEMTSGGVVAYVNGASTVTNIQPFGTVSTATICASCLTLTASSAQPLNVGGVVPPITASVLSVSSANDTICSGASTNLSTVVTGGAPPYIVTVTDGTNNYTATSASPVSIPVSPIATSTYSIVSVTGGVTGTGNTGSPTVTVTPIPTQPLLACYQNATFNTSSCSWVVSGTQPTQPILACYQTATFNTTSCAWVVSGTQSVPTFTSLVSPICSGTTLPNTSTNGISGTWSITGTAPIINAVNVGSNSYTFTPSFGQCGTTTTTTLTGTQSTSIESTIPACGSYTWSNTGQTYTTSGIYPGTTLNCQTQTLNLTITPSSSNISNVTACDFYTWANTGQTFDTSGIYNGLTLNCVTQVLNLTISAGAAVTTPPPTCGSYTWVTNGQTYSASGTYSSVNSCGTDILNLTILPDSTHQTDTSICGTSYFWNETGTTYTTSGIYEGTTNQLNGQCYTEILNLTIVPPNTTNTIDISTCFPYTWSNTSQTYSASGTYTGTTTNCVTEVLNLSITPNTTTTTNANACGSYTWVNNGITYTTSGVYPGTTANCVTQSLNLTITPSSTNTTTISSCGSYTWVNNAQTYTTSGVYSGTTANCVTQSLNLTITPSSTNTTTISSCGTYTWVNNGQTYTSSGVYPGTTANCVTQSLNLTIIPSTSQTTTITAIDTYTWAVNGLTYTTSGIYTGPTVNCLTQYLNLTINSSGISEEEMVLFSLYPNPVSEVLTIDFNGVSNEEYSIIDNFGSVVKRGVLENMSTEISVSELSAGLYYFKIEGTKPRKFSKIN